MKSKKGLYTISSLGALAIVLVVAAIVIAIGSQILDDIQDELSTETHSFNESITATNDTHVAITSVTLPNTIVNTSFVAYNETDRTNVILAGNYTVNIANYSIYIYMPGDDNTNINSTWSVSFNAIYYETAAYNATGGGLEGTETFGSWLDTIALIIVAAVVIGIIATSFGRSAT